MKEETPIQAQESDPVEVWARGATWITRVWSQDPTNPRAFAAVEHEWPQDATQAMLLYIANHRQAPATYARATLTPRETDALLATFNPIRSNPKR